jgi:hypothetical protein
LNFNINFSFSKMSTIVSRQNTIAFFGIVSFFPIVWDCIKLASSGNSVICQKNYTIISIIFNYNLICTKHQGLTLLAVTERPIKSITTFFVSSPFKLELTLQIQINEMELFTPIGITFVTILFQS